MAVNPSLLNDVSLVVAIPTTSQRTPSIFWTMMFKLYSMGFPYKIIMRTDYRVDANREGLTDLFLQMPDATHLLWWDDDIWPPTGAVARMLQHHYPMVSGVYLDKQGRSTCADFANAEGMQINRLVPPTADEMIYADMVGLGFCLMERRVLETVASPRFLYSPERGEDAFFFYQVKQALDVPVLVDGQVACGHEQPVMQMPDGAYHPIIGGRP